MVGNLRFIAGRPGSCSEGTQSESFSHLPVEVGEPSGLRYLSVMLLKIGYDFGNAAWIPARPL